MRSVIIFIFCSLAARASPLFDLSPVDDLRKNLMESDRELQFDGVCTELLSVFPFDGCQCKLNALQNNVQIICADYCSITSAREDLSVSYSYTVQFTLVPPLEPEKATIKEVQTGNASSKSTLVVETRYRDEVLLSCTTSINQRQCSSCTINTACEEGVIHDCRNLGLSAVVDTCNNNQLAALPSTNPFSTLGNDALNFDQCQGPPVPSPVQAPVPSPVRAPVPVPVRAPVPTPTSSGVPPKKVPPTDKDKDLMKLSNFDAGRGGLNRKLKSTRGE